MLKMLMRFFLIIKLAAGLLTNTTLLSGFVLTYEEMNSVLLFLVISVACIYKNVRIGFVFECVWIM